jgi:hypothetical protein
MAHHVLDMADDDGRLAVSSEMTGALEALPERVDRIEQKLDALSVSVDQRFDLVDEHFAEQRRYTEFAFERLDQRITRLERTMIAGFDRLEAAIAGLVDQRARRRKPDTR